MMEERAKQMIQQLANQAPPQFQALAKMLLPRFMNDINGETLPGIINKIREVLDYIEFGQE